MFFSDSFSSGVQCRKVSVKYLFDTERLMKLKNGLVIFLENGDVSNLHESEKNIPTDIEDAYETMWDINIYYNPADKDLLDELKQNIYGSLLKRTPERLLYVVCKSNKSKSCGFFLKEIKIKKPKITELALNYGNEFDKIHEKILKGLTKKEGSGIVLMHGEPGTGKTHYIRYLIQEIKDKKLIYIPPDMAKEIASPEFLPFMLENKDSILIIEDAENVIKDRIESGGKTQAVANILNFSDGLLGDSLHQPIIATFNCDVSKIDSALLRNGRLIANHEFKKLPAETAQKLSNELGFKTTITEPMTLADIYSQNE